VLCRSKPFLLAMVVGSIAGSFIGARLLGLVPNTVLLPLLGIVRLISAVKVWHHVRTTASHEA